MSDESNEKAKRLLHFVGRETKKMFKPISSDSEMIKSMVDRGAEIKSLFKDLFSLLISCIKWLYYYIFHLFSTTKQIRKESKRAAVNNFRIGLIMLKMNKVLDAKIRFLMSNMFFKKSPLTKYYIAYTFFLEHKYTKSLKYIHEAIKLDPKHQRSIELMHAIEKEMEMTKIINKAAEKTEKVEKEKKKK